MARVRTVGMAAALGLAAAVAGITPAATAGASRAPGSVAPYQSAACGAVPVGYATCLVHVWHHGTPGAAGPQRHHGTTGGPKNTTPSGFSPQAIAKAYGFTATGGAGQTIAVVDAFGAPTITADLAAFDSQYKLRLTGGFTKVTQTGGTTTYPRTTSGWALETSLDVEWAHALAPTAKILLVEATSNSNANLFAAVAYAAKNANYVSMSWGGSETSGETGYDSTFRTAAATSGVSFFAAAGDKPSEVIYPSSSPDVVSVGGTTLQVHSTGAWKSESAWSTAGGGCSQYETANHAQAAFSTYDQKGATCAGKRATPDLSLDANPSTGVAVYDTERVTGLSGWIQVGGTSASTVMVASHAAETASQVDAADVYGSTLKFYDVTSGSNGHTCVPGYNLCTGLGSWNTAAGTVNVPPATAGSLSFTTPSASATAGTAVPLSVSVTAPQTAPVPVTLSTSSPGGEFSATDVSFSSTLRLTVSTSTNFFYEDTKAGTPTLTATSTGWTSATKSVTVAPGPLTAITVSPATVSVGEGATQPFTATGTDQYGNAVPVDPAWTTTAPGTLTPATGSTTTFTAGATTGSGAVTATQGTIKGQAAVTVTATPSMTVRVTTTGKVTQRGRNYRVPLTVTATSAAGAVSGANVTLDFYSGTSCTGNVVATGTATTSSTGTASFTFSSHTVATYCAQATVTKSGYSNGTGALTFTT